MIGIVGRQISNPRTGLIAAAIAAVYANLWINDGMLLPEPMTILTMPIVLYAAYAFWKRPQVSRAIGLGLALGLAALSAARWSSSPRSCSSRCSTECGTSPCSTG